jgi:hypothetical protein
MSEIKGKGCLFAQGRVCIYGLRKQDTQFWLWFSSHIFELLASKKQMLLIWWNAFLVLNLGVDAFDSVCWFDFEDDRLSIQGFDEDLYWR